MKDTFTKCFESLTDNFITIAIAGTVCYGAIKGVENPIMQSLVPLLAVAFTSWYKDKIKD